jgi:putative transcription factor
MNFQDWNEVKWDKRGEKVKGQSDKTRMNTAMRNGTAVSSLRTGNLNKAGTNGLNNIVGSVKKIENEQETFKLPKVSLSMSKRIAQVRNEKKMSQKDLANAMCIPIKIIQDYESSKAIPNHMIINKMEKILGSKLRD